MTTPQPDAAPAASVINWYFGPVAWDERPQAMWHAQCPDPYASGHDGEVWLDHQQGAFCTGCRRWEPGQVEQDIPPARLAQIPPQPRPWDPPSAPVTPEAAAAYVAGLKELTQTTGTSLPASPDTATAASIADATEVEVAPVPSITGASFTAPADDTPAAPPLEPAVAGASFPAPAAGDAVETAAVADTPTSTAADAATAPDRPGILKRIENALEGDG